MFYHLEILLGIFQFQAFWIDHVLLYPQFIKWLLICQPGSAASLPVKSKIFLPTVAKCSLVVSTVAWYKPRQGL